MEELGGGFSGIGVEFNTLNDTIIVVNTVSGGPAERVGLAPNDRIVTINGVDVVGLDRADVPKRLRGARGTKVTISVVRRGVSGKLDFILTRDDIPLNTVDAAYMLDGQTGYISTKYAKKGSRVYEAPEAAPAWVRPADALQMNYSIESASSKIETYKAQNSDVIGWIKVPNTANIDYPVLIAADNDYYLNRDFNKKKKTGGAIYMDYRNATAAGQRHIIVYGHNMQKSKVDFYYLHDYMNDQNFFNTTRIIQMEAFGKSEWEVFSVHQSEADPKLIQTHFTKNAQFVQFCQSLAAKSKWPTNVTFQPTDEILSLVTCDTNTKNDKYRVFIHARRVK